ncbi:MAG: O-antigen ligase family protein [Candidatus Scalindua sp.]|nr:O-antigen ligase family protein [Candidatus Scalindua sp.]
MSVTAIVFVLVFFILIVLACIRNPIFGLMSYFWVFYNFPPERWWGSALPSLRWSLIAALITLIATILRKPQKICSPWHANWGIRILIFYTAWMWIQSFWALSEKQHLESCLLFTKYIILYYIIYKIVSDEPGLEIFSLAHIVGCFIFGWIAFRSNVSGRFETIGGPGINDANTLGMHMITGIIFAGFMFLGIKGKNKWIALGAAPFILNCIILTSSRGSMLGMAIGGIFSIYLCPKSKRTIVLGCLSLGIILLMVLAHDQFWERFSTIFETNEYGQREASAQSRIDIARYGFEMARQNPLGAGSGGHVVLSFEYMPEELLSSSTTGRSAHNTFMAVLVEQGYPGALLFVLLNIWIIFKLIQLKYADQVGLPSSLAMYRVMLGSSFAACFIAGQFGNFIKAEVQIWLLALFCIFLNLSYESLSEGRQA